MKVQQMNDGSDSRVILSHMVTSTSVLSRVASLWTPGGLFASPWENIVGSWCVEFFRKHGKAPNKAMRSLHQRFAETSQDDGTARLVGDFLSYLSSEHERNGNLPKGHVIDLAGREFRRIHQEKFRDDFASSLEAKDYDKADRLIEKYRRVEMGSGSYIEPPTDKDAIRSAFDENAQDVLTFPGGLGHFFRHVFLRDSLVAFQGSDKSGKSYWLLDLAVTGCEQHLRAAFFAIGDLSEQQMLERFYIRVAQHPVRNKSGKWPFTTQIPREVVRPAKGETLPKVVGDPRTFDGPLTADLTEKACARWMKSCGRKGSPFRMACYPNDTVNMATIRDDLLTWKGLGFVPDMVFIDYADILAPLPGRKEERDVIDANWKKMRSLASELHCVVVTATQANAKAYDTPLQSRKNFSGDKRKNAHVSTMVCINATEKERDLGVCRLNLTFHRAGAFNSNRVAYVAGNLAIARPHIVSTF